MIAYIDPGTGGVILQLLIAAIVGAGFYFRQGVRKVVSFLFKRKPAEKDQNAQPK